jgi:hypothetical protein
MTDITLDNLNRIENSVYDFGMKFCVLLEKLKEYMDGNTVAGINEKDFNLEDIIKHLNMIREEMHRQVDDIYKENSLNHLAKLYNDIQEQLNNLSQLKNKFKSNM